MPPLAYRAKPVSVTASRRVTRTAAGSATPGAEIRPLRRRNAERKSARATPTACSMTLEGMTRSSLARHHARLAVLLCCVASASGGIPAAAAPPCATPSITRVPVEPRVVVTESASAATVLARYRGAGHGAAAGRSLVAIVRLDPASSADQIGACTTIDTKRRTIEIRITNRRWVGPLAANVVETPYLEATLGTLPSGRWTVQVREDIVPVDNAGWASGKRFAGLRTSSSFEVR